MPIERTAEQERAAIVAWLRDVRCDSHELRESALHLASAIERGDHIEHSGYAETNNG